MRVRAELDAWLDSERTVKVVPRVALFNTQFLPYSQTFVYDEIRLHVRYQVEVFARRRLFAERFPWPEVHVAGPLYGYTRRCRAFDRRFGAAPFDLVHAHFGTGAVYALPFAQRHARPLVVSFHGHDVTRLCSRERYMPASWRYARVSKRLFERMTLGLCASSELQRMLEGLGVAKHKLRVHRLGVDLAAFAPGAGSAREARAEDTFLVIMIGRFVAKKGFEHGLRAFAQAASSRPNLRLTLIGDGPLAAELSALAKALGIAKRVEFTGALAPNEVARRLSASHVLLAPSVVDARGDRESGLIVVKEASASEVVPIGSRHGGIPDIIDDGVTGFLVAERDVTGLAERLGRLADDPALRERMARAARLKMEREYDNRACVERLERHYDDAIALHAGRA